MAPRSLRSSVVADLTPAAHTGSDLAFMQDMVGHHAQAIVMTALVPDRSDNEQLRLFVERMDITQVAEIQQMQDWLAERDEDVAAWAPVFGAQGGHSGGMMRMGEDDLMPHIESDQGIEIDRMQRMLADLDA